MERLTVSFIIEILGRPKEHLAEALGKIKSSIESEKGVKITNSKIHEPVAVENSDLFTSFIEIDAYLDSLSNYFAILFSYLPSHIEIIKPEKLALVNTELNEVGNAVVQRLHNYDAITKKSLVDRDFILEKLRVASPETFKEITKQSKDKKS